MNMLFPITLGIYLTARVQGMSRDVDGDESSRSILSA